jgi:O-antigen/teichoic acid export membrane protein
MLTVYSAILLYMLSGVIVLTFCLKFTYRDVFYYGFNVFSRIKIPWEEIKLMMIFSASLMGTQFLGVTATWGDSLILGYFSFDKMGTYSNVIFLAKSMLVMQGALNIVSMPMLARNIAFKQTTSIRDNYSLIVTINIVFIIPFLLVSLFYSPQIMLLLFGDNSGEIVFSYEILIVCYALSGFFGPVTSIIMASRNSRHMIISSFLFFLINITLSFLLIPLYEIKGAAVAAGLAFLLSNSYLAFFNYRRFNIVPSLKMVMFALISFVGFYPVYLFLKYFMINDIFLIGVAAMFSFIVTALAYISLFSIPHSLHRFKTLFHLKY